MNQAGSFSRRSSPRWRCARPATANAAVSATVTGDDGNPAALTAGSAAGDPQHVRAGGRPCRRRRRQVLHRQGASARTASPRRPTARAGTRGYTNESKRYVDYRGNGTYTLDDEPVHATRTARPASGTSAFPWTVNARVAISPPAPTMLTRAANSFSTITQQFNFAGNPGASGYEIKYAKGAVVLPDGSLSSPALKDGFLNTTTGKVELIGAREPGAYTIVARARYGSYYTPWTPPVNFNLIAPFDLSSRSFPDSRGPSYQVRAIVGEPSAGGKVTVAVAKGKKGKKFRTLGKGKVNSKGVFKVRFRLSRGTYRVRYSFAGSSTVAKGTVYEVIKITPPLG